VTLSEMTLLLKSRSERSLVSSVNSTLFPRSKVLEKSSSLHSVVQGTTVVVVVVVGTVVAVVVDTDVPAA